MFDIIYQDTILNSAESVDEATKLLVKYNKELNTNSIKLKYKYPQIPKTK